MRARRMNARFHILTLCGLLATGRTAAADAGHCAVCGKPIEARVYLWEDKIAGDKRNICERCAALPACYLCSVPTGDDRTRLADGRVLCVRDRQFAVLDNSEAMRICQDIKAALERHFSRFTDFPETNVAVSVVDRINLIELFKLPGHDYGCPNVLGFTQIRTNESWRGYHVSLMSGLTKPLLKATCAHEFGHTWIFENVSPARRAQMTPDAREGFCELVSYLLMNALGEHTATALIRSNSYTRGHIDLFIEAERRFGFNEIVEWMKSGEDDSLRTNDLTRVRFLKAPERTHPPAKPVLAMPAAASSAPDQLRLQGVIWSKTRPVAMINGRAFGVNEEGEVRLGTSNVTVHCLVIREAEVEIQVTGARERQTLRLKGR
jgi:hypothetical protein